MASKLTIDQLMAMEKLTGQEYTLSGTPRRRPRSVYDSLLIGISKQHHYTMKDMSLEKSCLSDTLKNFIRKFPDGYWPELPSTPGEQK
jgi:hypothetical protein